MNMISPIKPKRVPLSQRLDELKQIWSSTNLSSHEVARKLDCSQRTVHTWVHKLELPPRKTRRNAVVDPDELRKLWDQDLPYEQIARLMKCSVRTIHARAQQFEFPPKGQKAEDAKPEKRLVQKLRKGIKYHKGHVWTRKLDKELFKCGNTYLGHTRFQAKHPQISLQAIQARWHRLGPYIEEVWE